MYIILNSYVMWLFWYVETKSIVHKNFTVWLLTHQTHNAYPLLVQEIGYTPSKHFKILIQHLHKAPLDVAFN